MAGSCGWVECGFADELAFEVAASFKSRLQSMNPIESMIGTPASSKAAGKPDERIFAVAAWPEAPTTPKATAMSLIAAPGLNVESTQEGE